MNIPPEMQQLLAQLRQQHPQLQGVPDEIILQMVEEAMQQQTSPEEADMDSMSPNDCVVHGEQLLNQGNWQEAEQWFFAALEKADKTGDLTGQCQAAGVLGRLCRERGEFLQAMQLSQRALTLAERLNDRRLQGVIYDQIGSTYFMQGQYPQAIEHYKKCVAIMEEIDENAAPVYGNLGSVYQQQGDFARAIEAQEKSVALNLKAGNERGAAQAYGNLGSVYLQQGRYDRALEMYRKSLEITERLGDEANSANTYGNLGNVYAEQGALEQAIAIYEKALGIMQRIGDEPGVAQRYGNLAICYKQKGDTARALEFYRKSLDILERIGDRHNAANTYFNLGILYLQNIRDPAQARAHFEKANALYEMVGDAARAQKAARALKEL